jgi:hypothetical protein
MPLQNKDGSGNWPSKRHIDWTVLTAGPIELYKEYLTVSSNNFEGRILPQSLGVILRDIDSDGIAWVYHFDYGVMKFPVELLVAWDR